MNIEDIKKEISERTWYRDNKDGRFYNCCKVGDDRTEIIKIKDLFEILDKHKENKYKTMWEELYSEREKPCSIEYMQDLEEKYKIEVE